jgi:hydroxylamine dehydrogenase
MTPSSSRSALLLTVALLAVSSAAAAAPAATGLARSEPCLTCHEQGSPGLVSHWKGSAHARAQVGCFDCHQAKKGEPDAFEHEGEVVATIVTPRDCARCHKGEDAQFEGSHHAKAGNILASLDNTLAETVEGARVPFNPHSPTPGKVTDPKVNGLASVQSGCMQCHGAKVALMTKEGGTVTVDDLKPGPDGMPTNTALLAKIARDADGRPIFSTGSWPNTGIGRLNLDGSLGSCTACHSRHDFSARRARQPENCGKCHLGPDHPQKEIYDESKHGVAYRDLKDQLNLGSKSWILGQDYSQAPTCATCHMSATASGLKVTHDPAERISWTNRPPVSLVMDTDAARQVVTEADAEKRKALVVDSADAKRNRMKLVCGTCHTSNYVGSFYKQYDDLVILFNEKFAKPGTAIMAELTKQGLITKKPFDEPIEWTWYYLWHHEGRRARHGAAMMAPDYTHWHGMFEVSERFYQGLIPEARAITAKAAAEGKKAQADAVNAVIDSILSRPEHAWAKTEGAPTPAMETH